MSASLVALAVVAGVHAGFQSAVTVVVYPALAEVDPARWSVAHDGHSRRISFLVVPLYLAVLAVSGLVLGRGLADDPAVLLSLAGQGVALATTAFAAAPLHGRLGRTGPDPVLLHRLLLADRVRWIAALVGLAGALLAL